MGEDIINKMIARLAEEIPDMPTDTLRRIEQRMRQEFAGERHYVSKAPAEGKAFRLGSALAAGVPLAQAFADLGVSRASGFRLLARRWSR
jgi:hypothetical protein